MAIVSIEFAKGIPLEGFNRNNFDYQAHLGRRQFRRGLIIAKSLRAGSHPDLMPRSLKRFMRGFKLPVLVHPDGTATIAMRKEIGGNFDAPIVIESNPSSDHPFKWLPAGEAGLYAIVGMPQQTGCIPLAEYMDTGVILRSILMHCPGNSPKKDLQLTSPDQITDILNN